MPTYYANIPDTEAPTAEITASSTKHARTVYLDYLSRNNLISWRDRQATRGLVKVSQMQPGEIRTQVQLDYDMSPGTETMIEEAPVQQRPATFREGATDEEILEDVKMWDEAEKLAEKYPEQQVQTSYDPLGSSPIAKLSRKTKGM